VVEAETGALGLVNEPEEDARLTAAGDHLVEVGEVAAAEGAEEDFSRSAG
jgi:hypothetical protein